MASGSPSGTGTEWSPRDGGRFGGPADGRGEYARVPLRYPSQRQSYGSTYSSQPTRGTLPPIETTMEVVMGRPNPESAGNLGHKSPRELLAYAKDLSPRPSRPVGPKDWINFHTERFLLAITSVFLAAYAVVFIVYFIVTHDERHANIWLGPLLVALACIYGTLLSYQMWKRQQDQNPSDTSYLTDWLHLDFDWSEEAAEDAAPPQGTRILQLDHLRFWVTALVILNDMFECRNGVHESSLVVRWYVQFSAPFALQTLVFAAGLGFDPLQKPANRHGTLGLLVGYFAIQVVYLLLYKYEVKHIHGINNNDADQCFRCSSFHSCQSSPTIPEKLAKITVSAKQVLSDLVTPTFTLWYMLSLAIWRSVTPMWFRYVRAPFLVAMMLGSMAGFFNEKLLDFNRTLTYYPMFLLGVWVRDCEYVPVLYSAINTSIVRIWAGWMTLCLALVSFYAAHQELCSGTFIWAHAYSSKCLAGRETGSLSTSENRFWLNALSRIPTYAIAVVLIFCFLVIMPTTDSFIRRAGMHNLGPYVFHPAAIVILRGHTNMYDDLTAPNVLAAVAIMGIWIGFLYIPPVHKLTKWVLNPPVDYIINMAGG